MAKLDDAVQILIQRALVLRTMEHRPGCEFMVTRNPDCCGCTAAITVDMLINLVTTAALQSTLEEVRRQVRSAADQFKETA
ncbi:hypothetical protein LCGC14_0834790 [marine sediment metagenome]|uniref:Uncharacterized protein n=1 Tax=marine sediment metagenome TaxID=412755 RepID=A0A0F9RZN2_9ZZZZ